MWVPLIPLDLPSSWKWLKQGSNFSPCLLWDFAPSLFGWVAVSGAAAFKIIGALGCARGSGLLSTDQTSVAFFHFPCIHRYIEKLAYLFLFCPNSGATFQSFLLQCWVNREKEQALVFRSLTDYTVKVSLLKKSCLSTSVSTFLEFHRLLLFFTAKFCLALAKFFYLFFLKNNNVLPGTCLSDLGKNSSSSEITKQDFFEEPGPHCLPGAVTPWCHGKGWLQPRGAAALLDPCVVPALLGTRLGSSQTGLSPAVLPSLLNK